MEGGWGNVKNELVATSRGVGERDNKESWSVHDGKAFALCARSGVIRVPEDTKRYVTAVDARTLFRTNRIEQMEGEKELLQYQLASSQQRVGQLSCHLCHHPCEDVHMDVCKEDANTNNTASEEAYNKRMQTYAALETSPSSICEPPQRLRGPGIAAHWSASSRSTSNHE